MESNQLNNQYRTTVLDSTQSYCLCPKYKTFLTLFQWTFWTIWGYAHHWPISFQSCPVARAKYTSLRPRTTSLMTAPLRTSPQSWICDKTHSRMISDKTRNESTIVIAYFRLKNIVSSRPSRPSITCAHKKNINW